MLIIRKWRDKIGNTLNFFPEILYQKEDDFAFTGLKKEIQQKKGLQFDSI